jgi:hypothetical protein
MEQTVLEQRLLRCRYLVTRAAKHRFDLKPLPDGVSHRDAFIREWYRANKKAAQVLIDTTIELEADIKRATKLDKDSPESRKYRYWLAVVGSCCETFVGQVFRACDVHHLYKGPRFGSLDTQNVRSVLKVVAEINESADAFAFPLDFTRYCCTGDLLLVRLVDNAPPVLIVELKEGPVNEAIWDAREGARDRKGVWFTFLDKYGQKGIQQASRVFKQEKEGSKRNARILATRGIHRDEDGMRVVMETDLATVSFLPIVEELCRKARRGEYAVEVIDGCLMVAAVDTSSKSRITRGDFNARLFAVNAFINPEIGKADPEEIAEELRQVELINWKYGLGSLYLNPILSRPLSPRTFLDLALCRIQLLFFFNPPAFINLLRREGVRAELMSKKETVRERSARRLGAVDLPMHEGRAIIYYVRDSRVFVGSNRLHEMVFNWSYPQSLAAQIADAISRAPDIDSPAAG